VPENLTRRAHVTLAVEMARDEIQRRLQLQALRDAEGAWKDEDHPELSDGAAAWVSRLRDESEEIERHRKCP
jgi:hypothetical protein